MLIPIGFFAGGAAAGDYELLSSTVLDATAASVTLSSIPSTYRAIQVRYMAKGTTTSSEVRIKFNGSSANYSWRYLQGVGSTISAASTNATSYIAMFQGLSTSTTANAFAGCMISIPDYAANKNKTVYAFSGKTDSSSAVAMHVGGWRDAGAIASVTLTPSAGSFAVGSRFSIYGIKG